MASPAVVYTLIALAFIFLLSTSFRHHSQPKRKGARRLYHHVAFDPLVKKLERCKAVAENYELLDIESFREHIDSELGLDYYFAEEGHLNTTQRLMYLFPLLDHCPMDGHISYEELEVWNRRQALDRLDLNTEKGMKMHDRNFDGVVTLAEFLSHVPEERRSGGLELTQQGEPGWWKDLFENADIDKNNALNETELKDFLHPEDSSNPEVQMWVHNEKIRENDYDDDGKLNHQEFHNIYISYREFETGNDGKAQEITSHQRFEELDADNDKFLAGEELNPVVAQLNNGELSHASHYTKYLMQKADDNKDGKLTLDEMVNHHDAFYNAVYEDIHDDYYSDDDFNEDEKDEL